jgi:diguanylate cyclase (GGDEF)-like protein
VAIGLPLFFLYLLDSFAQRDELERKRAESARHDPLTGLLNRAGYADRAVPALAACRASGKPVTIAVLDIDHFKSINDGWGHAAGDAVLCGIARALNRGLREGDVIARVGVEEFILLLSGVAPLDALLLLDRLRDALSREVPHPGAPGCQVTASAGLALVDGDGAAAIEAATRRADAAVYVAKASGRNRAVIADPEQRIASLIL